MNEEVLEITHLVIAGMKVAIDPLRWLPGQELRLEVNVSGQPVQTVIVPRPAPPQTQIPVWCPNGHEFMPNDPRMVGDRGKNFTEQGFGGRYFAGCPSCGSTTELSSYLA